MDGVVSVPEAAEHLGLSPRRVRALIDNGALPAERLGAQWLIPSYAIADYVGRGDGRPMAPHVAWACLSLLAGGKPAGLNGSHASRLERRMNAGLGGEVENAARKLQSWCVNRAELRRWSLFRPALDELRDDSRLMPGGASADPSFSEPGYVEAYVGRAEFAALESEYGLPAPSGSVSRKPNLALRVVDDLAIVPRANQERGAIAPIVVGVDLLDGGDPRAVREGHQRIAVAIAEWRRRAAA